LLQRVLGLLLSLEGEESLDPDEYEALREERGVLEGALAEESHFLSQLGGQVSRVGDYDLLEEVGRGAMGVVFRARQVSLNREVALKIVLNAALASEADRQRFRFEAEAAAKLSHPHLIPVYDIGSVEGHDFYSMELVSGGTLADLMKDESVNPRKIVEDFLGVVDGVRFAHERGLIHRDLKPENILLNSRGQMMVQVLGWRVGWTGRAG